MVPIGLTPTIPHMPPTENIYNWSQMLRPKRLLAARNWRVRRVIKPGGNISMCVLEMFPAIFCEFVIVKLPTSKVIMSVGPFFHLGSYCARDKLRTTSVYEKTWKTAYKREKYQSKMIECLLYISLQVLLMPPPSVL
jgi:hypothetical protein